ncbi:MAG TPA: hypothetical protein VFX18_01995, partial [Candidatus Nitrosocosmicus sp.]|nr:hypothetical protein [Candidatus Nitrosocosmicus sp.]
KNTEKRDYSIVDLHIRTQYAGLMANIAKIRAAVNQINVDLIGIELYLDYLAKHEYDVAKEKKDLEALK